MRSLSGLKLFRRGSLLYRGIRYRKGFGVHSPFVYNLITKVIEERCPYYRFQDIELYRKRLSYQGGRFTYPDTRRGGKPSSRSPRELTRREAIPPKVGALLFRMANYFKPKTILQLGTMTGISTLYLTSYARELRCVVLDDVPALEGIVRTTFAEKARCAMDLRVGDYRETLLPALADLGEVDFVFFHIYGRYDAGWLFGKCLRHACEKTVFVLDGIRESLETRRFWDEVRACPEVTVTLDLYSLGIALLDKKLHKKNYIVYF